MPTRNLHTINLYHQETQLDDEILETFVLKRFFWKEVLEASDGLKVRVSEPESRFREEIKQRELNLFLIEMCLSSR